MISWASSSPEIFEGDAHSFLAVEDQNDAFGSADGGGGDRTSAVSGKLLKLLPIFETMADTFVAAANLIIPPDFATSFARAESMDQSEQHDSDWQELLSSVCPSVLLNLKSVEGRSLVSLAEL